MGRDRELDLSARALSTDPYQTYARLRANRGVHYWSGTPEQRFAVLSRYADVRLALRDPRFGSPGPGHVHPRGGDEFVPSAADIEPVRLQLRAIATELLEDLRPRDMFDVIAEFAAPLSRCILSEIRSSAPVDDLASWVELTVDLIGNGALALLNHRDQLAWLRATPEQAGAAVDELLRFDGPLQRTARAALVDVELPEGDVVQAGETLTLLLGAANRDYSQFAEPDRLDLGRSNANRHLAFGAGNHECLGSCWRGSRPRLAWGSWRGGCRHCISPSRRRAGGRASRCGGWKRSTWPAEAGPDLVVGDLVPKTRGDPLTPTGIPWSSMHVAC